MKKLLAMTAALAMPAMAMAGVEGVWRTEPNDRDISGHVEISQCGSGYCGVMVGNSANTGRFTGQTIVANMTTSDGVNFTGGTITDPERDRTYNARMQLNGDNLRVSGCVTVLGQDICRSQNWVRIQ